MSTSLLRIDDLSVRFGGLLAVKSLDLAVLPGEIHGLIGPNGAGKTTVFNVITRLYAPMSGTVSMQGRDILTLQPHQIAAAGIARTFQNIELFTELSVIENVLAGMHTHLRYGLIASGFAAPAVRRAEAMARDEAMRYLRLTGLENLANARATSLAFGQQRMLELARALAARPNLLLLDEPAAGMNSRESAELKELLGRIREEFSLGMVLIEHDMRVVMTVCDRLTVMQHGQAIFVGRPKDAREDPAVIEAYLGAARSHAAH